MAGQYVLTDVPEEKLETVKADFASEGFRNIKATQQPNGSWTVVVSEEAKAISKAAAG